MKKLFSLLAILLAFTATSQTTALVDTLSADEQIIKQISDDPDANFERVVWVTDIRWNFQNKLMIVDFECMSIVGDTINSRFNFTKPIPLSNQTKVDNNGNNDPNGIGEYSYLFSLLENEQARFLALIRAQISKLDSEGFFDTTE